MDKKEIVLTSEVPGFKFVCKVPLDVKEVGLSLTKKGKHTFKPKDVTLEWIPDNWMETEAGKLFKAWLALTPESAKEKAVSPEKAKKDFLREIRSTLVNMSPLERCNTPQEIFDYLRQKIKTPIQFERVECYGNAFIVLTEEFPPVKVEWVYMVTGKEFRVDYVDYNK